MSRYFLVLGLVPLSACFTSWRAHDDHNSDFRGWQIESSDCANKCEDLCEDFEDDEEDYAECQKVCVEDCKAGKECTRPVIDTPKPSTGGCTSSPVEEEKAEICQACKTADDCAEEGALCINVDTATGYGQCGMKCVIDCDCPDDYECHPVTDPKTGRYDTTLGRQCVPASGECPECSKDTDCKTSGDICENKKCVPGCRNDGQCGTGKICEQTTCVPGCRADSECSAGNICENKTCVPGCRADNQCPQYNICENKTCTPGCINDDSCAEGLRCFEDGRCHVPCCFDTDCSDGKRCNVTTGQCY
jgi:hypothetical protein